MRLYIEGHSIKRGVAISKSWSNVECSTLPPATPEDLRPVRFVDGFDRAKKLVDRWNRRFATHQPWEDERDLGRLTAEQIASIVAAIKATA